MPIDPSVSLDFLQQPPAATAAAVAPRPNPDDLLPQPVADRLMRLEGVGGVWIERDAAGRREVVFHLERPGPAPHLPKTVEGLPTRIVGGEPIRAL